MTRGNQMRCVAVPPFAWPAATAAATPPGCPLAQSGLELRFTGHGCSAVPDNSADTVYFMEGRDGTLYSGWADGHQGQLEVACSGPSASTGWAIFNGSSPRDLRLVDHGTVAAPGGVGGELSGRYPVAGADFDGVLYQGTYSEDNGANVAGRACPQSCGGNQWCIGGPFVGWQYSIDRGRSWVVPPAINSSHNVFQQAWPDPPEPFQFKIMFANWVDFGRNNEHSPDGAHYLVTSGCNGTVGYDCTWTQASHLYLLRIKRLSVATVNDPAQWEYYSGGGGWSSRLRDLAPIVAWPNRCGPPAIAWVGGAVQRFVLVVGTPTTGLQMAPTLDTWIAESSTLEGPYRLVQYLSKFGNQAYNPNMPSKFWNGGHNSTGWLWYSAMWKHIQGTEPDPPFCNVTTAIDPGHTFPFGTRGSCYGSVAAEVQLVPRAAV